MWVYIHLCMTEWETENCGCATGWVFVMQKLFYERDGNHVPFEVRSLPGIDGVRMR